MKRHHKAAQLNAFIKDHRLTGIGFHRLLNKAAGLENQASRSNVSQWLSGRRKMSAPYQQAFELVVLQALELKLQELVAAGAGVMAFPPVLATYGSYLGEADVFVALHRVHEGLAADRQELISIVSRDLEGRLRVGLPTTLGRTLGMPEGH